MKLKTFFALLIVVFAAPAFAVGPPGAMDYSLSEAVPPVLPPPASAEFGVKTMAKAAVRRFRKSLGPIVDLVWPTDVHAPASMQDLPTASASEVLASVRVDSEVLAPERVEVPARTESAAKSGTAPSKTKRSGTKKKKKKKKRTQTTSSGERGEATRSRGGVRGEASLGPTSVSGSI